jgi:hypothetical protein
LKGYNGVVVRHSGDHLKFLFAKRTKNNAPSLRWRGIDPQCNTPAFLIIDNVIPSADTCPAPIKIDKLYPKEDSIHSSAPSLSAPTMMRFVSDDDPTRAAFASTSGFSAYSSNDVMGIEVQRGLEN